MSPFIVPRYLKKTPPWLFKNTLISFKACRTYSISGKSGQFNKPDVKLDKGSLPYLSLRYSLNSEVVSIPKGTEEPAPGKMLLLSSFIIRRQ